MPLLAYTFAFVLPILALIGLRVGGVAHFAAPLFIFGFIPLAEHLFRGSEVQPAPRSPREALAYDLLLYALIPLHFAVLGAYLWGMRAGQWSAVEAVGATVSTGITLAGIAINLGHELGHRTSRWHQRTALLLYLSTNYAHFFIEHNRGHHARVATPEDPASAGKGEVVYAFVLRSLIGGYRSAWAIEARRFPNARFPALQPRNLMLRLHLLQGAALALVGGLLGPAALLGWIAASAVAIGLLEVINYVEHYGLRRERDASGRYPKVEPVHSWNSNRPLGRILLFDLTRHADHHAHPTRPYHQLRHFAEAPELPTGYPGMILLALCPPAWFAVMNPRVDAALHGGPSRTLDAEPNPAR